MKPVARVGDRHDCPIHGPFIAPNVPNVIIEGGSTILDGRPVARVGDKCSCGCVIVDGSTEVMCDNRPVAVVGSKTIKGGVITQGSPTLSVK